MANPTQTTAKLQTMADRLVELHKTPLNSIGEGSQLQWALRYGVLACIQLCLDSSCGIISRRNLGMPHNYRECIKLLEMKAYIDDELSEFLIDCLKVRENILHPDSNDTDSEAYRIMLQSHLFRKFADSVDALEG